MFYNFILVKINSDYCDYLRKYDVKVPYNKGSKELRPFVGVLFNIDDIKYFAPLSSPKLKHLKMHNTLDFYKIKNGKLGAINFNNMIPVTTNNYILLDIQHGSSDNELKYNELLREQLEWLNAHFNQVNSKAKKLYKLYLSNHLPKNIINRCCNFKLLEEKCQKYNQKKKIVQNVNV